MEVYDHDLPAHRVFPHLWSSPFSVMMIGIVMFGPLVYTRLAVDGASYDCVTAAVETFNSQW